MKFDEKTFDQIIEILCLLFKTFLMFLFLIVVVLAHYPNLLFLPDISDENEYKNLLEEQKHMEIVENYETMLASTNYKLAPITTRYIDSGIAYSYGKLDLSRGLELCRRYGKTTVIKLICKVDTKRGAGDYKGLISELTDLIIKKQYNARQRAERMKPLFGKKDHSLEENRELALLLFSRGKLYFDLKQYANALRDFELSLLREQINKGAMKYRSLALDKLGRAEEAKRSWVLAEEMGYL